MSKKILEKSKELLESKSTFVRVSNMKDIEDFLTNLNPKNFNNYK